VHQHKFEEKIALASEQLDIAMVKAAKKMRSDSELSA